MLFDVAKQGLIEHPTAGQLVLTVILVLVCVFLISLAGNLPRFIRGIFDKRQRLGGPYD